jgi:CheY-like chemotaxis protein
MTAQKERLLAAGASEYLTKPLNVQKFLSVLDRSLENVSG